MLERDKNFSSTGAGQNHRAMVEYFKSRDKSRLVHEEDTTVIIDCKNAGIGSNSRGPELAPEYQVCESEFSFTYTFKPLTLGNRDTFCEYVK